MRSRSQPSDAAEVCSPAEKLPEVMPGLLLRLEGARAVAAAEKRAEVPFDDVFGAESVTGAFVAEFVIDYRQTPAPVEIGGSEVGRRC